MNVGQQLMQPEVTDVNYFYIYYILAAFIALYLILKGNTQHKAELFILAFYLLTGNSNDLLTFKIPGISFFEIQPLRLLFLVFSFFLLRKFLFDRKKVFVHHSATVPWFLIFLFLYVAIVIISQASYAGELGFSKVVIAAIEFVNFIIILYAVWIMTNKETVSIVNKAMIIGAIFTTLISFMQIGYDPLFMRVGDHREAFGDLLRANGLFSAENYNSYFLITTIGWVLIRTHNKFTKYALVALFTAGVLCTFHRMSYLILSIIFLIYFIKIEKLGIDRLAAAGLGGAIIILSVFIFYYSEIMNSAVVQERLSQDIGGRAGYYSMVFNHIGEKPVFGYGGKDNEVYYISMMKVTREMNRATGTTGGIHSGYLSSMFYYGIPAFICYTLFVILSLAYFGRLSTYHLFFAIPFIISLLYAIGNLTNTFLFSRYLAILYAIHIGLGMGARHLEAFFPVKQKSIDLTYKTEQIQI